MTNTFKLLCSTLFYTTDYRSLCLTRNYAGVPGQRLRGLRVAGLGFREFRAQGFRDAAWTLRDLRGLRLGFQISESPGNSQSFKLVFGLSGGCEEHVP